MRPLLLLLLAALPASAAPASVDTLTPDDVTKAVSALKENFVRPEALSEPELSRATLQGLLDRLAPGASLLSGTAPAEAAPFYSEAYNSKDSTDEKDKAIGYLRPGDLTPGNIAKAGQALKDWSAKALSAEPAMMCESRPTPTI